MMTNIFWKEKFNIKIYDVAISCIIYCPISYEVKATRQTREINTEKLVPDFYLFFEKALYEVKASDLQLGFNIF